MRIHIASITGDPSDNEQCQVFARLAAADEVGIHSATANPDEAEAILFVDLQRQAEDPWLKRLRRHPLARQYGRKVFVYDERDRPFFTFPGIYVAGRRRDATKWPMLGGPYSDGPLSLQPIEKAPSLLFSFQGARTHPVREAVLELTHPRGFVQDTSDLDFFPWKTRTPSEVLEAARSEYIEMLADSKFVLCPRGHGLSSFRLFETLSAGRVPVVLSDHWLVPPGIPWEACTVRIPEGAVSSIPEVLEQIEPEWEGMAETARRVVAEHFAPGRRWNHYATSLESLLGRASSAKPWWLQSRLGRIWAVQVVHGARR